MMSNYDIDVGVEDDDGGDGGGVCLRPCARLEWIDGCLPVHGVGVVTRKSES